jgi:tRNA(fMet)-specific endonuclease VapC
MFLLDSSVLIPMRDDDKALTARVAALGGPLAMSIISQVELEGGVQRKPHLAASRRSRLDAMLEALPVLAFADREARAYGEIVAAAGCSRRKLLDRMIAAQALVAGATLVTLNPDDFADVPGLSIHPLQA